VLLCVVGGLIGIGLGVGSSLLVAAVTPLPAVIAWWSPALAFTVSAAVGVFFGWRRPGGPVGWTRWSRCAPSDRRYAGVACPHEHVGVCAVGRGAGRL
jgi:hypothetical protein